MIKIHHLRPVKINQYIPFRSQLIYECLLARVLQKHAGLELRIAETKLAALKAEIEFLEFQLQLHGSK